MEIVPYVKEEDIEKPLLDPEIGKLTDLFWDLEKIIFERIEKLPGYGEDCKCDNEIPFLIADGNNIIYYCLNCGGYTEL